jgi:uncharacterized membrane protein YebE (DUF533 family)
LQYTRFKKLNLTENCYTVKNPYHVAGGVVATAALAYVAYAMYNSNEVATN